MTENSTQHLATAEREAGEIPGFDTSTPARPIGRVGILGAGTMGGGIAMSFVNAGLPVTLVDATADGLARGLDRVRRNYEASAARGRMTAEQVEQRMGLISGGTDDTALAECDLVIEAVFEDLDLKRRVCARLGAITKPGAIIATNTSTLDVDLLAQASGRPADFLGMHFFSPANVMRLLEIVRGKQTSPETIATASEVGKRLGKVSIVVGNCFGFVGNRMLSKRTEAAERLLLDGASPQEVDRALTDFGFKMGPFAMADLAGLDIGMRIRKAFGKVAPVADAITAAGRYGQKTGKGYYVYEGRTATPDPAVDAIIEEQAAKLGITRRTIGQEEIIERLVYPMINEGAKILDEGIADRPGDIDAIWLHGYNWPAWKGGPMFYADLVGRERVRDRLTEFASATGDETLRPAPGLTGK